MSCLVYDSYYYFKQNAKAVTGEQPFIFLCSCWFYGYWIVNAIVYH